MIILKVTEDFTLGDFHKLKNIVRYNSHKDDEGRLYEGDEFECDREMADYLMGGNRFKKAYAEIKEIIPEIKQEVKKETRKPIRERMPKKIDKKK